MNKMKEDVFDYLKGIGLMPEYDEEKDITVKYMMSTLCFLFYDNDERYLQVILPNFYCVDENNRSDVLEVCNEVSLRIKVVKCYITHGGNVWLSVELLLDKTPIYEDIIPRTLRSLIAARMGFIKEINK